MVHTRHSRCQDEPSGKKIKREMAECSPPEKRLTRGSGGRPSADDTLHPVGVACRPLARYADTWQERRQYEASPFRSARSRRVIGTLPLPRRRRYNVEYTEIEVRRSGRKRKMVYDNFSDTWITTQIAHSGLQQEGGAASQEVCRPTGAEQEAAGDGPSPPPSPPPPPPPPPPPAESPARRQILLPPLPDNPDMDMDMYSRVKRVHRAPQRFAIGAEEPPQPARVRRYVAADSSSSDGSSDEDEPAAGDESRQEAVDDAEKGERLRPARACRRPQADHTETKVIKKYYLRENRREPEFYQDESLQLSAARDRRALRDDRYPQRYPDRWPHHRHHRRRSRKNAAFNESTTDSSSDRDSGEEGFERRKARSMQSFRNKCLPLNFSKADASHRAGGERRRVGTSLADVDPMSIDRDVNFDMIGGLKDHIRDLKEMILLPLLYPEVFSSKNITPPKGVLFCGPPGTGKTLMARALANECSIGDRKVAFFMRKGADVLSKWVGESERQLRLLFDQAYQMRPSIIFFDEIDGLAPVRSSKQDYIHSSIVSTLLALMDGVDSRGEVIVIGATNRPDSVDPALRRPGRFDREFYFPLPPQESREQILRLSVSAWRPPVPAGVVSWLARQTAGYCGADLTHLVTEAVLIALRERYPQIYRSKQRLLIDCDAVQALPSHFRAAMARVTPAGQRDRTEESSRLPVAVRPLLAAPLAAGRATLRSAFPWGFKQAAHTNRSEAYMPRLLVAGRPGQCHTEYLAPALLHGLENVRVFSFNAFAMHGPAGGEPLNTLAQLLSEAARCTPSVVYLPRLDSLWSYLAERLQLREPLLGLLRELPRRAPLLLLATCDTDDLDQLPAELTSLFSVSRGQVQVVRNPGVEERHKLFSRLFMKKAIMLEKRKNRAAVEEELPVAPPPPPRQLSETELRQVQRREERRLAELRIFLREMCGRLIRNRQFELFRQPVEEEDAPDYYSIIEKPMDLDTIMTRIDQHKYEAAEDFLADVDLICTNALEYNPDTTEIGREIRHRACMLRDQAHKLIAEQLDSDFEEECKAIRESRRERAESPSKFAPSYLVTPRVYHQQQQHDAGGSAGGAARPVAASGPPAGRAKPRRRSRWSQGLVSSSRRRRRERTDSADQQQAAAGARRELGLSGELGLVCGGREPDGAADSETKAAPPDEDSGHGSTAAASDEQLGKLAAGVQVDRARLLYLLEKAVALTAGWTVSALEDLHDRLLSVVRRYAYRRIRDNMIKEMEDILETY